MTRPILLLLAFMLLALPAAAQEALSPREAVSRHVTGMLHAIDARDWDAVRAAFADEVFVDYTSLNGGEAGPQASDVLVGGWKAMLPGFEATQHLTGPMVIELDGEEAEARMAVTATHRMDGLDPSAVWTVGGHYVIGLAPDGEGWLIDAMTLQTAFVTGDTSLPEQARGRVDGD